MNRQLLVWKLIAESLQEDIPVMLLYVLESKGSSPGRGGFFMAVNAIEEMEGSIGGGIMEHKFVEMAKEKLQESGYTAQVKKQVHDQSATKDRSGMICSGEQTIFIYQVQKTEEGVIQNIISSLEQNKNGSLILTPASIEFSDERLPTNFYLDIQSETDWVYKENIGYKDHLYIIGGGHCALAFSKIMSMMDFYIHVFDDREDLNTLVKNEFAHEKQVINSYKELTDLIPSGESNYVVIMTFGYRTDDIALRALLDKNFKYLGLLGSKKKIEEMFNRFREEGTSEETLKRIYSPVGLPIKSQTPEEIAISIAAEIIAVKNT